MNISKFTCDLILQIC